MPAGSFLSGGMRKSFELILEFDFSVMPASLFVSVYLWASCFSGSNSEFSDS
jgi:hypothetical protein